jgi:hypothetical protein
MERKESGRDPQIIFLSADPIAALARRGAASAETKNEESKFGKIEFSQITKNGRSR